MGMKFATQISPLLNWTWPKNDNDERELVDHDRKLKKGHNDEHEQLNMTEIKGMNKMSSQRQTWMVEYDQK